MFTGAPALILKIRKWGVPAALLRTTTIEAPEPDRVVSLAKLGKAESSVITAGPGVVNAAANKMTSGPASALAFVIASRKVQPLPLPTAVHAPSSESRAELTS